MPALGQVYQSGAYQTKFAIGELPEISPWIFEEISSIGLQSLGSALSEMNEDIENPQTIGCWVSAISRCRSDIWQALAQG